ncbi:hypothetical protein MU1_18880 [Paenibacillus glycanilyticus]|uniref:DUF418 domain-containing protein n=1 Tax=Paenibacillus glycanilyticus TaxID=126569 RepID=A0ABQ6G9F4_9BACL|nr:hypothetical protein MU1_18880 [Paenibacillus glycanilyticus]
MLQEVGAAWLGSLFLMWQAVVNVFYNKEKQRMLKVRIEWVFK